jgi:hypothetical protein
MAASWSAKLQFLLKSLTFICCVAIFCVLQKDIYEKYKTEATTIGSRFENIQIVLYLYNCIVYIQTVFNCIYTNCIVNIQILLYIYKLYCIYTNCIVYIQIVLYKYKLYCINTIAFYIYILDCKYTNWIVYIQIGLYTYK